MEQPTTFKNAVKRGTRKRKIIPKESLRKKEPPFQYPNEVTYELISDIKIEPDQPETISHHQEEYDSRNLDGLDNPGLLETYQELGHKEEPSDELSSELQPSEELGSELQLSEELSSELQPSEELSSELQPSEELSSELQPSEEHSSELQPSEELSSELQPTEELSNIGNMELPHGINSNLKLSCDVNATVEPIEGLKISTTLELSHGVTNIVEPAARELLTMELSDGINALMEPAHKIYTTMEVPPEISEINQEDGFRFDVYIKEEPHDFITNPTDEVAAGDEIEVVGNSLIQATNVSHKINPSTRGKKLKSIEKLDPLLFRNAVKCSKCKQYFISIEGYFSHIDGASTMQASWKCVSCNFFYNTKNGLSIHIDLKHNRVSHSIPIVDVVLTQDSTDPGDKSTGKVLTPKCTRIGSTEKNRGLRKHFLSTGSTEMNTGQVLTQTCTNPGSVEECRGPNQHTDSTEISTGQVLAQTCTNTDPVEKCRGPNQHFLSADSTELSTGQVLTQTCNSTGSIELYSTQDQHSENSIAKPSNSLQNLRTLTTCFKCKILFESTEEFLSHACETIEKCDIQEKYELPRCVPCCMKFDTQRALALHIQNIHPNIKSYKIPTGQPSRVKRQYLKTQNNPNRELYNHISMYHIQSNIDQNQSISYALLIETYSFTYLNSYECLECGKVCKNRRNSSVNEHACFKNKNLIRCKVCNKCHCEFEKVEQHLKDEHENHWNYCVSEDTVYCCSICEELFVWCKIAEKYKDDFEKESSIKFQNIELFRIITDEDSQYFKYKINDEISYQHSTWIYSCILCRSTSFFNTARELEAHFKSIHPEDVVFKTCSKCDQKFYNMSQFYEHVQSICKNDELNFDHFNPVDTNNLNCDVCMINFDNMCCATVHQFTVHMSEKINMKLVDGKYSCPACNVVFSDEKLFFAHCSPYTALTDQFKTHSKCKICGVNRESQLHRHVTKEHNSQLIHCTKCFSNVRIKPKLTLSHLSRCNRTIRSGGAQLFTCPICGLRFQTCKMLLNHINIDIRLLESKKYQCKHCFNYFFSEFNLCAHLKNSKCLSCNLYLCGKQKLNDHFEFYECKVMSNLY